MAGSARDRFAYLRPGCEEEARDAVARELDGLADVQLVRDMVARGYYNSVPPSEEFLRRMMEGKPIERVHVRVEGGDFGYGFD